LRQAKYLNGTAPLNVTGAVSSCVYGVNESLGDLGTCTFAHGSARDSFLWADELHPSEQADRRLAQQLHDIYTGKSSKYITFYGKKL
jgi:phospholipase/lecithinase/hemolysin